MLGTIAACSGEDEPSPEKASPCTVLSTSQAAGALGSPDVDRRESSATMLGDDDLAGCVWEARSSGDTLTIGFVPSVEEQLSPAEQLARVSKGCAQPQPFEADDLTATTCADAGGTWLWGVYEDGSMTMSLRLTREDAANRSDDRAKLSSLAERLRTNADRPTYDALANG